ncbi:RecB-like exonuclease/helicase [Microbacterium phage TinyMiny]|nr:RecB-like exonuclease/helicase [Microbacterium phage TinyMiny]UVF61375.1 RecB-like exonuclease/helicase [Microbacterium phage Sparcetus]
MLEMRTSERGSLGRCARQWAWRHIEGLEPNRSANPLWFGSAVHEGLAAWYLKGFKRGPHPAETFDKFLTGERSMIVTSEEEEIEYVDARALGIDMLTRYVELYGNDDSWNVIATEMKGKVVLPRPQMKIFGRVRPEVQRWLRYHFTWDGVYRDEADGRVKLMEHKTAASIITSHLPLDNQAGSYHAVANQTLQKQGVLKGNEEIVAITYNFLRKAMADQRPRNADGHYTNKPVKQHFIDAIGEGLTGKETLAQLQEIADQLELTVLGDVSKSQPPEYFERHEVYKTRAEREQQIRRIQDEALFSEAYRKGFLPIVKSPSRDCGWCAFSKLCEMDESGDQDAVEVIKETMYHVSSPYETYQTKSAE